MFEFDRAVSIPSLYRAWEKIKSKNSSATGIDNMTVKMYQEDLENNIQLLNYSLLSNSYEPYKEKIFISKNNRKIYISCIEDKIIQIAIAQVLSELLSFHSAVHSFIKGRSIFTAYNQLKQSIKNGKNSFYKVDIKKFYESIPRQLLLKKINHISGDKRFLNLIKTLIMKHQPGISTGSSLSPILSNIFLMDFDDKMATNLNFYLRYVDDMLIAPNKEKSFSEIIDTTNQELNKIGLVINDNKSKIVNADEGFKYLGFDIINHNKIDTLIQTGNMFELENILKQTDTNSQNKITDNKKSDMNCTLKQHFPLSDKENDTKILPEEESTPNYILAIEKKCHMIKHFINKAKHEKYLSHPEKKILLYTYYVLGKEGEKYLHKILSYCMDYSYNITQGYINNCNLKKPVGCRKICDSFEEVCNKSKCKCNFSQEKIYPTPVIHAIRQKKDCFVLKDEEKNIGHFKKLPPKQNLQDILAKIIELNKKSHEINIQKNICKDKLEELFERNAFTEFDTPYGLLIKNPDGFFIKID